MCPKDITDVRMPRRDSDNRLIGPPIVELEIKRDIMDQHILIGGENIKLRMKKERATLFERYLQFEHPKKYCRSDRELCTNCAEHLQKEECTILEGTFASTAKNHTEDKSICEEYKMEATIQNKMRLD